MTKRALNDWIWELYTQLPSTIGLSECDTPEEIANVCRPWIEKLAAAVAENAMSITPDDADGILKMVNLLLDPIERACDIKKLDGPGTLALIWPIDDILVGLSLFQSRRSISPNSYEREPTVPVVIAYEDLSGVTEHPDEKAFHLNATRPQSEMQPREFVGFLRALYANLTKVQRRTWHRILHGRTVLDISEEDRVARSAVYARIHSMAKRNGFCKRWWRRRGKRNQHE